jgi:hypothetical protein
MARAFLGMIAGSISRLTYEVVDLLGLGEFRCGSLFTNLQHVALAMRADDDRQ